MSVTAVHDWYHRLEHVFEPDRDRRKAVAVDGTNLEIEDEEVYIWAAVDVDTFKYCTSMLSPPQQPRIHQKLAHTLRHSPQCYAPKLTPSPWDTQTYIGRGLNDEV